ncbi:hypothetical protein KEM56_007884 [Ascosphaera pollenicola]|nr:hypothetical protein KEM56_007884 [Ascosphaera pollenicola]
MDLGMNGAAPAALGLIELPVIPAATAFLRLGELGPLTLLVKEAVTPGTIVDGVNDGESTLKRFLALVGVDGFSGLVELVAETLLEI